MSGYADAFRRGFSDGWTKAYRRGFSRRFVWAAMSVGALLGHFFPLGGKSGPLDEVLDTIGFAGSVLVAHWWLNRPAPVTPEREDP